MNTTDSSPDLDKPRPATVDAHVVFKRDRPSFLKRIHGFLHGNPTVVPAIVLAIGIVSFSLVIGPRFFDPYNFSLILQQVTIIGIIACAQTLIVLTAGIDLSVGALMVFSSVVLGQLATASGLPIWIAMPAGFLVGILGGLANGCLVTFFRMPPFIATLGTWSVFLALNLYVSESRSIRQQEIEATAPALQWLGTPIDIFGARPTYGSILMILLFLFLWFMLNRTAFGRHIYAVGDDPEAARLSGIQTRRTILSVYVIAGLICSIAAWALIGRIGSVSPLAGGTTNLDSITAVVIGGTSLFGGRGSIIGTLIGALIVGVFRNGIALAGLDVLWQEFTVGILIIVAVALDQWIRRASA